MSEKKEIKLDEFIQTQVVPIEVKRYAIDDQQEIGQRDLSSISEDLKVGQFDHTVDLTLEADSQ